MQDIIPVPPFPDSPEDAIGWYQFKLDYRYDNDGFSDWKECVEDKKVNGQIDGRASFDCFKQRGYKFIEDVPGRCFFFLLRSSF